VFKLLLSTLSTFKKSGAKLVIAHLPKIFTNNFCSTFSKSGLPTIFAPLFLKVDYQQFLLHFF
jgi:hypothetical protein